MVTSDPTSPNKRQRKGFPMTLRNDDRALAPVAMVLIGLAVIGLIAAGSAYAVNVSVKNDIIQKHEKAVTQFDQVGVAYQKAFSVLPKLFDAINATLTTEARVMENITALRSGMARNANGSFEQKDDAVEQASVFIKATAEAYPQLQSVQNFQIYYLELINSYNSIRAEKIRYNDYVQDYNAYIKSFGLFPWSSPNEVVKSLGPTYEKEKERIRSPDMPNVFTAPAGQTY